MKNRVRKTVQSILILFLVLACGITLYSVTIYRGNYPDYSSYNTGERGIKAIYLLSKKLGYQTGRYQYPAQFLDDETLLIVYRPDITMFNEEKEQQYLEEWIVKGNTLVLIPEENKMKDLWIFNLISQRKKQYEISNMGRIMTTWYQLDSGAVCVMDGADSFINANLKESEAGVAFIRTLEKAGKKRIVFNEYYHYLQKPAPEMWKLIGIPGRLVVFQLYLVLVLCIVRGWKPFGRVCPEREWMKRPENELLNALSGLYIRMKACPLVLANYYGYFLKRYGRILNVPSPLQGEILHTLTLCEKWMEWGQGKKKEMLTLMQKLQKCENEIKKGMRRAWE